MIPLLPLLLHLQPSTITIDPRATQGRWEGWGTSLCWMGKMFGDRDDVADLLFSMKTVDIIGDHLPGLGMNIVRYNAGACSDDEVDGRKMVVSKTILPFRQMEGFWKHPGENGWDWSVDANQRAMLLKAKARGANRFELFSNSPMWWMCANDNPSGAADASQDNLRGDQADAFAVYLAEVAVHAKRNWGVTFTTVEPFNEPLSHWWDANCKQEGCHFSVQAQVDMLPRLRSALDARGLRRMPIAASDETHVSHAIQAWKGYPANVRRLLSQVNVHGYEGEKAPRAELRTELGQQKLWLSEHGEADPSGLEMARNLGLDFQGLHPTAWCYWQPLDGGGWGFLSADVPHVKILRVNPKYFVMAQYTRHLRPGMSVLTTTDPSVVAALDTRHGKLILVLTNTSNAELQRTIDLSLFSSAGEVSRWRTSPKATARYEKQPGLACENHQLSLTLPAASVETLEVDVER